MPTPEELEKNQDVTAISEPAEPKPVNGGIVNAAQVEPTERYKAPAIEPVTTEVDAPTETVESRLTALTAKGSTYTDMAKRQAIREANTRGLINTTMAAGAGTEAAIKSALPIAQQDAELYAKTRFMNQEQKNEFLRDQQSAALNRQSAAQESGLRRGEAEQAAGFRATETEQAAGIQTERDIALSQQRLTEAEAQNRLNIDLNKSSADLNMAVADFQNDLAMEKEEYVAGLKTDMERIINDDKFSQETKINYVNSIKDLTTMAQQQIVDVGLSDRTPDAQAAAITRIETNRDAAISVYEDLLGASSDWDWGTDFTPTPVTATEESVVPVAGAATGYPPGVPAGAVQQGSSYWDPVSGMTYDSNGNPVSA